MRISAREYTGTSGVYAQMVPDYETSKVLTGIVGYTSPPFQTPCVPYTSHVTLICSDTGISTVRMPFPKRPIQSTIKNVAWWEEDGKCAAVCVLESPLFKHVHSLFVQKGAKHRHVEYIPHLTLALDLPTEHKALDVWTLRANDFVRQNRIVLNFNCIRIRDMLF